MKNYFLFPVVETVVEEKTLIDTSDGLFTGFVIRVIGAYGFKALWDCDGRNMADAFNNGLGCS